jgi:hypothetical protein
LSPRLPTKVLNEDNEYIIETTPWGGVRRNHKDFSPTPEIIDTPVKCKDDWPKLKKLLSPDFTRFDWRICRANFQLFGLSLSDAFSDRQGLDRWLGRCVLS